MATSKVKQGKENDMSYEVKEMFKIVIKTRSF